MGERPYRPLREIEHAIDRDNLTMASAIARDFAKETGRPIPLDTAAKLLRLRATKDPDKYDDWARHWLVRWLSEKQPSAEQAAEMSSWVADLPVEPHALDEIIRALR